MLHKYIKSPHSSLGLDAWGMLASGLCAVHCLAIPVLLALGASAGVAWLETPWLITAIGLAAQSLVGSYRREHGRPLALWVAGAGFAVLVASRLAPENLEHYLTAVGGFAIATAHWINWKLRRQACLACR
ncbi:MAG TPA: MerC domain-containing protein [Saprospiraceae bacterium]|nr:MerC domain-containing protein [Saprospiraceae bacterium]